MNNVNIKNSVHVTNQECFWVFRAEMTGKQKKAKQRFYWIHDIHGHMGIIVMRHGHIQQRP